MNTASIKGLLFDYGGTIDSNGMHWAEVIWLAYQEAGLPIEKSVFREAYVHGERTLARNPIVKPHHTFRDMMLLKMGLQLDWLKACQAISEAWGTEPMKEQLAAYCYKYASRSIDKARPVIKQLSMQYPLVLVSNFYGNIAAVLTDFGLDTFFRTIIESAVVGVRKPDPEIFRMGVEALHLQPNDVVVIGDSYDKDIVPARSVGCHTIWLKSIGWEAYTGNETADIVIEDFGALTNVFYE